MDTQADLPETPAKRHKCAACYKQYKKKEHLIEHMKISYHSVHQPKCGVCQKRCKSFESLREHLTGPSPKGNCSEHFSQHGCPLCLKLFDSPTAVIEHKATCYLSAPTPLGTEALTFVRSPMHRLDSPDENNTGRHPGVIAIDCEMVGGGSDGSLDLCARVCMVDEDENLIFHTYVQPQIPVTNYRYDVTGLTEEHLRDAMPLEEVQEKILQFLYNGESIGKVILDGGKAKLLVGHDLVHDLDCLKLPYPIYPDLVGHDLVHDLYCLEFPYPAYMLRDTAKYRPLMKTNLVSHSLKYLTRTYLGYDIHTGTHDPYEDCVSVMRLYKRIRGQVHTEENSKTFTSSNVTDNSDYWKAKELENSTPDELFAMSNSNYRCWCLDSM